jgi:ammonia channel protein AmtB
VICGLVVVVVIDVTFNRLFLILLWFPISIDRSLIAMYVCFFFLLLSFSLSHYRKNLMDISITALCYYAVGYAFAYGDSNSAFIGNSNYFLIDSNDYVLWFFQFVFAGTTATIVSGSVAERCRFRAYIWYTIVLTSFIYPVTSHWIWSPQGFFYGKVLDFAGSGAVHMLGGAAVRRTLVVIVFFFWCSMTR